MRAAPHGHHMPAYDWAMMHERRRCTTLHIHWFRLGPNFLLLLLPPSPPPPPLSIPHPLSICPLPRGRVVSCADPEILLQNDVVSVDPIRCDVVPSLTGTCFDCILLLQVAYCVRQRPPERDVRCVESASTDSPVRCPAARCR